MWINTSSSRINKIAGFCGHKRFYKSRKFLEQLNRILKVTPCTLEFACKLPVITDLGTLSLAQTAIHKLILIISHKRKDITTKKGASAFAI
jgi:hypothetical protein